jgi:DNA helicase HerA-like ATPase
MASGDPIGRVVCVSGTQVVAMLTHDGDPESMATRVEKGTILKILLARSVVFCMVSGISVPMPREAAKGDETRLAELELLGESPTTVDGEVQTFRRGIRAYPALGDCLHPVGDADLACLYNQTQPSAIAIGTLHHASVRPVNVSPDNLLGKHFAVLGTTGSGKSCAVTVLLRSLLETLPHAHVVLLDPHNEYPAAFGDRAMLLGPESLQLPYWLLNADEVIEIVTGPARGTPMGDSAAGLLQELIPLARKAYWEPRGDGLQPTIDTPVPYRLGDLERMLDERMGRLDKPEGLAPYRWLRSRLAALVRDARYAFMFGGIGVHDNMARILSTVFRVPSGDRPITIIDLSAIPSETLNVVVSVVLRMAFDFALWSGGRLPMLLVCEEAHRYAPAAMSTGFEPTKQALARVAKEGRKYSLSLGMVSQRPSEIDASILSQCNTVFALRMTSLRDQEFLRGIINDNANGLLDFLPALGDAEAIVAGQAVAVPLRVRFTDLAPEARPRSAATSFSSAWRHDSQDPAMVDEVVRLWRRQYR